MKLTISDYTQIGALLEYLEMFAPTVTVKRTTADMQIGAQGALDLLVALASSSGLVAAIRTLPDFIRSRRTDVSIILAIGGEQVTVTATNIDDVMPILERILNA